MVWELLCFVIKGSLCPTLRRELKIEIFNNLRPFSIPIDFLMDFLFKCAYEMIIVCCAHLRMWYVCCYLRTFFVQNKLISGLIWYFIFWYIICIFIGIFIFLLKSN